MKTTFNGREIDLIQILRALQKKWYILLAALIGTALCALLITKLFVAPTYRANFTAYVNNMQEQADKTTITNSDLTASRSLASTYIEIIKSRSVLTRTAEITDLDVDYSTIKGMVSADTNSTTEIITVSVTTTDPELSLELAKNLEKVAQKEIIRVVDGSSMVIIDEPVLPMSSYSPHFMKITFMAGFLGLLVAAFIISLLSLFNDKVIDESELEERFGLVSLGTIPDFSVAASQTGYGYYGSTKEEKNG